MEPTRRLTSYAQQLRTRITQLPEICQDDEVIESLNYIERDAARLRTLIRDVQLYLAAGTPRGEVRLEDPNALLAALLQKMPPNTRVEMTSLPLVMLDRARLNDLFSLLLDNAIKHGQPADPQVSPVICISGEREGALSRFRISDNGCGIPAEYLERVFEIFERLGGGGDGGAGIGLSIARSIVESRHGKIWIENLPYGGAMVVFELPDGASSC
jgi:signal transduction histidine kinase